MGKFGCEGTVKELLASFELQLVGYSREVVLGHRENGKWTELIYVRAGLGKLDYFDGAVLYQKIPRCYETIRRCRGTLTYVSGITRVRDRIYETTVCSSAPTTQFGNKLLPTAL